MEEKKEIKITLDQKIAMILEQAESLHKDLRVHVPTAAQMRRAAKKNEKYPEQLTREEKKILVDLLDIKIGGKDESN